MFDLTPFRRNEGENTPTEDVFDVFKSNWLDDFMDLTRSGFRTDIKETNKAYVIEAELPGLTKEDINLEINNNNLIISVTEENTVEDEGENYIRRERRTGSYQRSFRLDNVNEDEIEAEYNNGILEITLPKEEPDTDQHKVIDIN